MQQLQQQSTNVPEAAASHSATRSLYDVKAMQKEAVLSYVKVINVKADKKAASKLRYIVHTYSVERSCDIIMIFWLKSKTLEFYLFGQKCD
jgi:hypothetical protein